MISISHDGTYTIMRQDEDMENFGICVLCDSEISENDLSISATECPSCRIERVKQGTEHMYSKAADWSHDDLQELWNE